MRHPSRPKHKKSFDIKLSLLRIISNLIIIAILIGFYYFCKTNNLFPYWINHIYYAVKIIVALQILYASARSLLAPMLALLIGLISLFTIQVYQINLITLAETSQLLGVAVIGFLVNYIVKHIYNQSS